MKTSTALSPIIASLILSACPGQGGWVGHELEPPPPATAALDPLPEGDVPGGAVLPADWVAFDVEHEVLVSEADDAGVTAELRLVGDEGRRTLWLNFGDDSVEGVQPVVDASFIGPVDWVTVGGETSICWNEFVGASSSRTLGAAPDPTGGVDLLCRTLRAGPWSEVQRYRGERRAAWLLGLREAAQGAEADLYEDDGWMFLGAGADARVRWTGTEFEESSEAR